MFEACMDCRIQGKFIRYFPGGGKKRILSAKYGASFAATHSPICVPGDIYSVCACIWFVDSKLHVRLVYKNVSLPCFLLHNCYRTPKDTTFTSHSCQYVWQAQVFKWHTSTAIEMWDVISVLTATLVLITQLKFNFLTSVSGISKMDIFRDDHLRV